MRRLDQDDLDLLDMWAEVHPEEDDEPRDPLRRRVPGQAGAEHVFASMTRYRIDAPGT